MDFSPKGTKRKQDEINSSPTKVKSKVFIIAFRLFVTLLITIGVVGIFTISGFVKGIIDTSPSLNKMDVVPSKFPTKIYDSEGNLIQELKGAETNREYVTLDKIPKNVQNAFISIEDERFYEHNGIDIKGIFRASFTGLSNGFSQGASTITQQLIKNTKFDAGMEDSFYKKIQRKVQEQYLAIKLENKLTKKEILEYYLNTINLGAGTYGVQTASKTYFDKPVEELSISEACVIASITQQPTALNPIEHPKKNKTRMLNVLEKMYKNKYITKKEYDTAKKDKVYERINAISLKNSEKEDKSSVNSYFVDAMYESVLEDLINKAKYPREVAENMLNSGGLQIYTTLDSKIQGVCDDVINDESNYPVKLYQLNYDISVTDKDGQPKNYHTSDLKNYFRETKGDKDFDLYFNDEEEGKKRTEEYKEYLLENGNKLLVDRASFILQPQVAMTIIDHSSGAIKAIVGGRGEKITNRGLVRTEAPRQPGSTFKILSAYVPALDTSGMTLATVQNDVEYKNIHTWDGGRYKGLTTIREGIWNSNNVVAAKTYEQVTTPVSNNYLKNLGITTLVEQDNGLSVALGGLTKGVTNLELTAAYAAIANNGTYNKPFYYTKIVDSTGNVILEHEQSSKQVMKETTAWLLTDAMHDTVTRGTGTLCNFSGMYVAGKTGTTTSKRDLLFAGYTPYFTSAIWSGYDLNDKESRSSSYHKIIWRKIMSRIHEGLENKSFSKPSGISSVSICTKCGKKAIGDLCSHASGASEGTFVRTEYFASGTAPSGYCTCHQKFKICTVTGHAASEYCPSTEVVYLIKDKGSASGDAKYLAPEKVSSVCTECDGSGVINELFGPDSTASPEDSTDDSSDNDVISSSTPVLEP